MGGLRCFTLIVGNGSWVSDSVLETITLGISLLLTSGFILTERWFRLKDRLEGRFGLIAEVDRSLIGVLKEDRIHSIVCQVLSNRKGYRLAWIAAGDPDGSVRVVKSSGDGREIPSDPGIRWDDSPEGRGLVGNALRTGVPGVVNRMGEEPHSTPWERMLAEKEVRSAASVRIEPAGNPPLALTVYADTRSAFDRVELESVSALAHRIGTAIQSARRHEFFVCAKGAYDDLLKNQRDGVILVRGEKIVRINVAAAIMLGYPETEDFFGRDPAMILRDPERDPELREFLRYGGEAGGRYEAEAGILRRDGSSFAGEITVTWLPRENRKTMWAVSLTGPLGMVILRDITQRKQVMEDLRRERDFSARILDISGILVAHLGPGGEILRLNHHFEEVTGYTLDKVSGRQFADLVIPGAARGAYRESFSEIFRGKAVVNLEFPLVAADGGERRVIWNHAPLRDATGRETSVIVTGTDVTESRKLERQIIEMQKMEAVGTLAGGIAHDFNNILTGILGNLDLVQKSVSPDSAVSTPVQESIKASERAANMVRQLLDFSRRAPSERKSIHLGKVVQEVSDLFAQTIDKRIVVETSAAGELWLARADPNQMHQVMMNLCVNARDAIMERLECRSDPDCPDGGFRISISTGNVRIDEEYCRHYPYARQGEYVVVSISDNGAGMDEAMCHRIFEPFFTTKKLGRGTGLGLSTVYGIIKQHDGWINLETRAGQGTTFRAYLPKAVEPEEENQPVVEEPRTKTGKETILFVDDEEMIRSIARQILENNGYSVLDAADGQEAIDLYIRHRDRIDLVILDMTMPHLAGSDVLSRIRKLNPGAKVILSSGYHAGEAHRASAFLPKPYRAGTLARVVREVLDR